MAVLSSTSAASSEPQVRDAQAETNTKKKRSSCPGVRVIGSRIYDPANGKTCHQCRQKTRDFAAECANLKGDKQCPIKFCHKCLLNRYGEKAEEVSLLGDWKCPKCRGICNCSFCMKKKGQKPTGILVHAAKATGYSSVSEMLNMQGPDNLDSVKAAKSPKEPADSDKVPVLSPKTRGKENSCTDDVKLNSEKTLREGLKEMTIRNTDYGYDSRKKSPKRPKISKDGMDDGVSLEKDNSQVQVSKDVSLDPLDKEVQFKESIDDTSHQDSGVSDSVNNNDAGAIPKPKRGRPKKLKEKIQHEEVKPDIPLPEGAGLMKVAEEVEPDIPLPEGAGLMTVAGIELPSGTVGQALQFLEFCAAFAEALDLKKGRAESIIREVIQGQDRRRCQYISTVQFHIQLLTLIQEDLGEKSPSISSSTNDKNSWLQAFRECISESQVPLKELPSDCFDRGLDGYAQLDPSEKLGLLNFLCDEALGTVYLRGWIDDQNSKFLEKDKESKQKVLAAKDKEKLLKQKLQNEVASAIIANNAPLSISEHQAIVAQIKDEAAQAHAEVLEAMGTVPSKGERCAAVRTEPLLLDANGRAFWNLKCCSGASDLLLQEMGTWDAIAPEEKWFTYGAEQKPAIEKYLSSKKLKKVRKQKQKEVAGSSSRS